MQTALRFLRGYFKRRRQFVTGVCVLVVCTLEIALASAGPLFTSNTDEQTEPLDQLEKQRFGELNDKSVQAECDNWIRVNKWKFGRSLSEIRESGSKVTAKDVMAALERLRLEESSQYGKRTKDKELIRDQGIELAIKWAKYPMDKSDPGYLGRVSVEAKALLDAGSTDPLIKMFALCYAENSDPQSTYSQLAELDGELKAAGYSASYRFVAQRTRIQLARQFNTPDQGDVAEAAIATAAEYAEEVSGNREAIAITWSYISGLSFVLTDAEQLQLYRIMLKVEKLDPYLLHMFASLYHYNTGWRARGGGLANSVSEESWKVFQNHQSQASLHYRKAWLLRPDLPDAAAAMISIANANGGNENWTPRNWFELACNARFDYGINYNSYMQSLQPRWSGSHEAMLQFGVECAETKAFETPVPYYLIDLMRQIGEETSNREIWTDPSLEPMLTEFWSSMHTWGSDHPEAKRTAFWRKQVSLEAAIDIRKRLYKEARTLLESLEGQWDLAAIRAVHDDPEFAVSIAFALSDPASGDLLKTEEQFGGKLSPRTKESELAKALEKVRTAKLSIKTPQAERYLRVREYSLTKQQEFLRGDWVELEFDDPLTTWGFTNGQAVVESSESIRISSYPAGWLPIQAFPNVAFAPPFTVTATIERIEGPQSFEYFGINAEPISEATKLGGVGGIAFVVGSSPTVAGTWLPGRQEEERFPVADVTNRAEFQIDVWATKYKMTVNGTPIPVVQTDRFRSNGRFSIGSNPFVAGRGALRVSDVKIRKLAEPAPK